MTTISTDAADAFIARWSGVTASELSTAQSFALDLCRLRSAGRSRSRWPFGLELNHDPPGNTHPGA